MHLVRRVVVVLAASLVLAPAAPSASKLPLPTRLAHALEVPGNSPAASGAIAVDIVTAHTVFERHADAALIPASNEKLAVTYAALVELGPAYRFRTEVVSGGRQEGATWHGNVYLKGFGDPTLTSLGLARLAAQLKQKGIRRIDGLVVGDDTWFDSVRTAPGWKSSFFLYESPPLTALAVDHGVYDGHLSLQPTLAAAGRFKRLLRGRGITAGGASVGAAPADAYSLAQVESDPLSDVLVEMDRESDNFTAELLVKEIGREIRGVGSTAAGVAVVLRDLGAAGVPLQGVLLFDGSGLSVDDRFTVRALAALLLAAWNNPELRAPFLRALPVAGVSGTLDDRMQKKPTRGVVRAKTGTTNRASALAGYVGRRYVFAVIQNGFPVQPWAARKAQDRFATALASTL
jgi:D-alanyl-D-alanine carboxypeptidase/D-alanyl-D-alanine-endopeptidase (penicillin-binding protein 4)